MIYLDNAATSFPKPPQTYDAIATDYKTIGVNPGRGGYLLSLKALDLIQETRNLLSAIFFIDQEKIHFSPSITYALNQIIFGLDLLRNSVCYISPFEHNSVYRPLNQLSKSIKLEIHQLKFNNYEFESAQFNEFFDCDLMVLTHQSNVTGQILPINEICKKAKQKNKNIITIIDGAQCGGYYPLDWKYIDFYCFSGHKSLYGPSGIAGFINNSNQEIRPLIYGGTGIYSEDVEMPTSGHERYEVGSQNILSFIGLNASLKWIKKIGIDNIISKTLNLADLFLKKTKNNNNLIFYRSDTVPFSSTVSFNHNKYLPQDLEMMLSKNGIYLRSGMHCAPLAHKYLKTINSGGTIRFSPGYFNNEEDIIKLSEIINSY